MMILLLTLVIPDPAMSAYGNVIAGVHVALERLDYRWRVVFHGVA